jgi:hypothetical protein
VACLGRIAAVLTACAMAVGTASCTSKSDPPQGPLAARTRPLASAAAVVSGPPGVIAAGVARKLFASAPVVVVASANRPAALASAAVRAERQHAPLLLTAAGAGGPVRAALRAEITALRPRMVLADGVAGNVLAAQLPKVHVVTDPAELPATRAAPPLRNVVMLAHRGWGAATVAAAATARVAGVRVLTVRSHNPGTDPAVITDLAAIRPRQVIAVGAGFGPAPRLAYRVTVAATGVQLPGGGQVLFPEHRLVALYGHPGTPSLGALGQQDLSASIARIKRAARPYRALSSVPVIPTFEIIATVALAFPGPDGLYSYQSSVASLRPWVKRASAAGMYVVLDLQAGRASLLAQAKRYRALFKLPNVGLALDPEWKLGPGQLPLRQIGSVSVGQVNAVIRWLAALTAKYHLPQKALVLHQFRLSMIRGESRLDTRHADLAIVIHMDGQGTPGDKQQTWDAVTGAAPPGVFFGWKNFYTKDHPVLTPWQTMDRTPQPVMISYQ